MWILELLASAVKSVGRFFYTGHKIASLEAENSKLKDRIVELEIELGSVRDSETLRRQLVRRGNAYWKRQGDGSGPFCVGCVDARSELISLVEFTAGRRTGCCPLCKMKYYNVFGGTSEADARPIPEDEEVHPYR